MTAKFKLANLKYLEVRHNQLYVARTRMPISRVLAELADGEALHTVCDEYDMSEQGVAGALLELAKLTCNSKGILDAHTANIYGSIVDERERQDIKWGGPYHDDQHTSHDWVAYIVRHAGRSVMWPFDVYQFRSCMVKVAALAVAAIEWSDRLLGRTTP